MSGPISYQEICSVLKDHPNYLDIDVFVESGTYLGETIFPMSKHFRKLYTIELSERHFANAVAKAEECGVGNITFLKGRTEDVLPKLLENLDSTVVFFLDAHFCGAGTDSEETEVPLLEELKIINRLRNHGDVVIIDDAFVFGRDIPEKRLYWSEITLERILSSFDGDKIYAHFIENDRCYILLKKN